jgi:hypothetical protein
MPSGKGGELYQVCLSRSERPRRWKNAKFQYAVAAKSLEYFEFCTGNRVKGVNGTLWASYDGITEMDDDLKRKQTDEQRLTSIWFGEGYAIKARPYQKAVDCMKTWAG